MFQDDDPKGTESILAVEADVVGRSFMPGFTPTIQVGGSGNFELRKRMLNPRRLWVGPRETLEYNPAFRQLVSYGVVVRHQPPMTYVLVAERNSRSGEQRLHGTMTLGFGGHISVDDLSRLGISKNPYLDAVWADRSAIRRELSEELSFASKDLAYVPMGVVFDDETAVSRVHVGLVTLVTIGYRVPEGNDYVTAIDPGISNLRWVPVQLLRDFEGSFETWSMAIARYLMAQY
jgi:predicted NUDIX family phosphoesterase